MTDPMTALVFSAPSLGDKDKTSIYWAYANRTHDLHACDPEDPQQLSEMAQMWQQREAEIYAVSECAFAAVYAAILDARGEHQTAMPTVRVCSPLTLAMLTGTHAEPGIGAVSNRLHGLRVLSEWTAPISTGGFRPVSVCEAASYAVISAYGQEDPGLLETAVKAHPMYPALSMAGNDTTAMAVVVARMIDPRNHVHARKPDRMSALRRRFEVHPFGMASLYRTRAQLSSPTRLHSLSRLHYLDCLGKTFAGSHWLQKPQSLVDGAQPLPLLLQARLDDLKKNAHPGTIDPRDWWLGGSRLFLRFLRDVWLDGTQDTQSQRPVRLCDYSHYFPAVETLAMWIEHREKHDNCKTR